MKKIILFSSCLFLFTTISIIAQDVDIDGVTIRNTINTGGEFIVTNDDVDNPAKLEISETGEVNWFLNKQNFFLRDSEFEAFPIDFPGVFTPYDFIHVDGATGRIGFNILADTELPLTSSIHLNGSISTRVRTLDGTDNYELKQDDHTVIVSLNANNVNIDLPPVASAIGRGYRIKRDGSSGTNADLTIRANGGELIDGSPTYTVSKTLGVVEIVCDGTQWWILSAGDQFVYSTPVTTNATLTNDDSVVGVKFAANSENFTINLPDAANFAGKRYEIKRNVDGATHSNNDLYIKPSGSDKLNQYTTGSPYQMSNNFESVTIQSNGTMWLIINAFNN